MKVKQNRIASKQERITIQLPAELKEKIVQLAKSEGKSVSRLVCEILEEHLKSPGEDIIDRLLNSPLDIPGFKPIPREKLYER